MMNIKLLHLVRKDKNMVSMKNMKVASLANREFSNVRIMVDYGDYHIGEDTRLLIPFSYYQHFGLMNKDGDVVVEPKFDRIIDTCRKESDVVRIGIGYTYGFNHAPAPYTYHRLKWGLVDIKGNYPGRLSMIIL